MREVVSAMIVLLCTVTVSAGEYRYSVGATAGGLYSRGGDILSFDRGTLIGGEGGFRLGERWFFATHYGHTTLSHYSSPAGDATFGDITSDNDVDASITRIGGALYRTVRAPGHFFNVGIGIGGGAMIWSYTDPIEDTIYKVKGVHNQKVDFGASELFLSAGTRLLFKLSDRLSSQIALNGDYLTGGGAEFDASVDDHRDRWMWSSTVSLNIHFGTVHRRDAWPSESAWKANTSAKTKTTAPRIDADNDGVPDEKDRCASTPVGAIVDVSGCPIDTDRDGVPDGLDDCSNTSPDARGLIDVDGCPIDADFDGLPDYVDSCPHNAVGAVVDATGCPVDSDKDGVADGLDDCPNTLVGAAVDSRGCLDMTMFAKPMILSIDYDPGGFEVDAKNKSRLEQLARVLTYVSELKLEVACYTDDIGSDSDNKALSERRANRVRDYLVAYGVSADRITAVGRGETKFAASNQTAEGRAKNRRIEISFSK